MKSLLVTPILGVLLASTFTTAGVDRGATADDIKPKIRSKRWQEVTARAKHLRLVDGRRFYRGPRSLRNLYPYYLAANAGERSAGHGYELRIGNAHRLFAPVATAEAAAELARLLSGGIVVPDLATYSAMRDAAVRLKPSATGWGIEIHEGVPKTLGLRVRRVGEAWRVSMLVFTCSGYSRLSVLEQYYTIPAGGAVTLESKPWLYGPPQSWQTAGDFDKARERALYDEVQRFRAAMMAPLARHRTIEPFEKVCARDPTFAEVRARMGEPDRDIGSGIHIYFYRLGDGTAVLFGAARDDDKLTYVRHVEVADAAAGRPKIGRILQSLK